jgi:hypothetical protein
MALTQFEILKLFKEKIIDFLDALVEKFPKEKDFISIRILITDIPVELIINKLAERILPFEDMIVNENEKYLLECNDLFEGIKGDKVSYFKKLWCSEDFTSEDKKELWKWFKVFLKLTKLYFKQ